MEAKAVLFLVALLQKSAASRFRMPGSGALFSRHIAKATHA